MLHVNPREKVAEFSRRVAHVCSLTAAAALCVVTASPLLALAKLQAATEVEQRQDAPSRFDPPATDPLQQSKAADTADAANAAYEACIDHPSPDGAAYSCEQLLQSHPAAGPNQHP